MLNLGFALLVSAGFVGEMDMRVSSKDTNVTTTIAYGKGGAVRVDSKIPDPMSGKEVTTTLILKDGMVTTLMHDQRKYITMRQPNSAQTGKEDDYDSSRWEVKKLGTKRLHGYTTQHVRVVDKKEKSTSELWIAPAIDYETMAQMFRKDPNAQRTQKMLAIFKKYDIKPGFPLKMTGTDQSGKTFTMEVTRIVKGKQSASKFRPPKGYAKFDTPSFGGGPGFGGGKKGLPPGVMQELQKRTKNMSPDQKKALENLLNQ